MKTAVLSLALAIFLVVGISITRTSNVKTIAVNIYPGCGQIIGWQPGDYSAMNGMSIEELENLRPIIGNSISLKYGTKTVDIWGMPIWKERGFKRPITFFVDRSKTILCSVKIVTERTDVIDLEIAQQVDSAEASTIAVPPSDLSGSPR